MNEIKRKRAEFLAKFREQHPAPYFTFTNIESSENLAYEMLSTTNHVEIYSMFKDDDSPYISETYQNLDKLEEYADYQLNFSKYSMKRGAADWLFKLKETGEYIGLLNVYDLSLENFAGNDKKCTIGFSTKKDYRRKSYTQEAVRKLIQHIFKHYPEREKITAQALKNNEASNNFLKKIGFEELKDEFYGSEKYDFYEVWKAKWK